jgi:hypothetical protein
MTAFAEVPHYGVQRQPYSALIEQLVAPWNRSRSVEAPAAKRALGDPINC